MGARLSTVYFEKETGRPNLRFLTLQTLLIAGVYAHTYLFSLWYIRDNGMLPNLRPAGFPFSDTVLYKRFNLPKEKLVGQIVEVRDPFTPNRIVLRRVIA